ncbi:nuclease domain-containing protein [Allopusillimonas ginsengisoli]|uniref:nuclease domain-containing protein n=1 Tax=Allopusillimonas ginsengisoli TaxID=453575 RepID=UPI0039C223DE
MMKRSPFKRTSPKKRTGHNKAMLAACKDQPCYLRIPGVCIGGTETVVPCHANWPEYGKGMGLKAKDIYTVPGCFACHAWLDQGPASKVEKKNAWEASYQVWNSVREIKLAPKQNPATAVTVPGHVPAPN